MFTLSESSKRNSEGVDQRLIEIRDLALVITLVDFGHGPDSGLRTAVTQNALYRRRKSRADGVNRKSKHQSGKALDFFAFVDGDASWEHDHLAMVAAAFFQAASILGYRIKWGGLWKSKSPEYVNSIPYGWDCAHIELLED